MIINIDKTLLQKWIKGRSLLLIFGCILMTTMAFGQRGYQSYNNRVQKYFEDEKWEKVIEIGEKAIAKGTDYFQLRYKMGIAYYEMNNYFASAKQFEKALEFNSAHPFALEYLYFSYLFSERQDDALLLSKTFSKSLRKKLKVKAQKDFEFIYVENNYKRSNEQDTVSNLENFSVWLGHRVNEQFSC